MEIGDWRLPFPGLKSPRTRCGQLRARTAHGRMLRPNHVTSSRSSSTNHRRLGSPVIWRTFCICSEVQRKTAYKGLAAAEFLVNFGEHVVLVGDIDGQPVVRVEAQAHRIAHGACVIDGRAAA